MCCDSLQKRLFHDFPFGVLPDQSQYRGARRNHSCALPSPGGDGAASGGDGAPGRSGRGGRRGGDRSPGERQPGQRGTAAAGLPSAAGR
ncbi:MAG: hypothetical protein ACK559_22625 [bacterium]